MGPTVTRLGQQGVDQDVGRGHAAAGQDEHRDQGADQLGGPFSTSKSRRDLILQRRSDTVSACASHRPWLSSPAASGDRPDRVGDLVADFHEDLAGQPVQFIRSIPEPQRWARACFAANRAAHRARSGERND